MMDSLDLGVCKEISSSNAPSQKGLGTQKADEDEYTPGVEQEEEDSSAEEEQEQAPSTRRLRTRSQVNYVDTDFDEAVLEKSKDEEDEEDEVEVYEEVEEVEEVEEDEEDEEDQEAEVDEEDEDEEDEDEEEVKEIRFTDNLLNSSSSVAGHHCPPRNEELCEPANIGKYVLYLAVVGEDQAADEKAFLVVGKITDVVKENGSLFLNVVDLICDKDQFHPLTLQDGCWRVPLKRNAIDSTENWINTDVSFVVCIFDQLVPPNRKSTVRTKLPTNVRCLSLKAIQNNVHPHSTDLSTRLGTRRETSLEQEKRTEKKRKRRRKT